VSGATLKELSEIFEEVVDLSGIVFERAAVLGDDVPVDSKEMLRIFSRIEAEYRFRFDPKDVLTLKTVGDLLEIIRCRRAGT